MFSLYIVISLFFPVHVLTLTDIRHDHLLFHQMVVPGDTFKTMYLHSLQLTPVWEVFRIRADYAIMLTDAFYESSGAGLPIPDGTETLTIEGNRFHLAGINRHLPTIALRVNVAYHNTFVFQDTIRLNLSALVGNAVVRIETRRERLYLFFWQEARRIFDRRVL